MKVLFVGLGSIGRRHLKNLAEQCRSMARPLEVVALRHLGAALPPEVQALVARQVDKLDDSETFDAAFITNPTQMHAETLAMLRGRAETLFIEKPIFDAPGQDLAALGLGEGQKAYVAAPMRWCGVYRALKALVSSLPVYSVRSICSSYLPEWRAGVDYREVYSARREMGGGVALDLIHEWDYLVDLFGLPQQSVCMQGHFSHLEISSDDLAIYIARYKDFLCELHLDYFGRSYRREVEVFSTIGTLRADFGSGLLTLPDGAVQNYAEDANRRYEREMEYFLNYALYGEGESLNSPRLAQEVLKLAAGV